MRDGFLEANESSRLHVYLLSVEERAACSLYSMLGPDIFLTDTTTNLEKLEI